MNRIRVENIGKRYVIQGPKERTIKSTVIDLLRGRHKKQEFWALRNVSFCVRDGETLGIIGPNGAGKSTLLGLIAGTLTPTEGKIEVNGTVSTLLELGAGFHPDLSGRENIYLNGSILGLSKKEIDKKFKKIVEFAELEPFIDVPVKHYSSGMYVRLGFAVAVEVDPDILLIDEVLAVGDAMFRRKCLKKIDEFQKSEKSMLVVSHDLETLKKISHRILLLDEGRVIELGDPAGVVDEYLRSGLYRKGEVVIKEWGSREVEIVRVEMEDEEGKPAQRFLCGRKMRVKIYYKCNKDQISNPVFGFSIADGEGQLCYGTNTQIEGYKIDKITGKGMIELEFPQLTLLQGKYYLSLAIHSWDHLIQLPALHPIKVSCVIFSLKFPNRGTLQA